MRTRTHLLMLLLASLLVGSVGSVVAVASTTQPAHACSIAPPWAEVTPTFGLEPGQAIEITGYGFADLIFHGDEPQPIPAVEEPDAAQLPPLCDFDLIPMQSIEIVWYGNTVEKLAVAAGPDFRVKAQVPLNATPGEAWIAVGHVEVAVSVGPVIKPPPPCPLVAHDDRASHECPDPWPCADYPIAATQSAPDVDVAPGYLPPCPEPCVDYAQTAPDGTLYDYKWDCPDPCGHPQEADGEVDTAIGIWCPPPDPCAHPQEADGGADSAIGIWCPPPDPCHLVGGDALVCPDPCLYPQETAGEVDTAIGIWCPPPDPCHLVGGDARVCPDPCPVYLHDAPARVVADTSIYCPDPCGLDVPLPLAAEPGSEAVVVWCGPGDDVEPQPATVPQGEPEVPEPTDAPEPRVEPSVEPEAESASAPSVAAVATRPLPEPVTAQDPPAIAAVASEEPPDRVMTATLSPALGATSAEANTEPVAGLELAHAVSHRFVQTVASILAALFGF